jgi:hypothetical protein
VSADGAAPTEPPVAFRIVLTPSPGGWSVAVYPEGDGRWVPAGTPPLSTGGTPSGPQPLLIGAPDFPPGQHIAPPPGALPPTPFPPASPSPDEGRGVRAPSLETPLAVTLLDGKTTRVADFGGLPTPAGSPGR